MLIPAVCFGKTAATAAAEADATAIRQGWPPGSAYPQTRVEFLLTLQSVLDLTDSATLKSLQLKKADLTQCDWSAAQTAKTEALTQAIARAAFENRLEGLIVPSARKRGGINIVAFPAHLLAGSSLVAQHENAIPFMHGL